MLCEATDCGDLGWNRYAIGNHDSVHHRPAWRTCLHSHSNSGVLTPFAGDRCGGNPDLRAAAGGQAATYELLGLLRCV